MKKLYIIIMLAIIGLSVKAQWVQTNLQNGDIACIAISGNNIFAGNQLVGGGMSLSTNSGQNWSNVGGLSGLSVYSSIINGTNMFAGTNNGGVYLSTDTGTNWTSVSLPSTVLNVMSFAISGNKTFVGAGNASLYLSTNNGGSWTAANTGLSYHSVNALAISGSKIFAGTGGGGLYLSTNNGTNWTSVTGIPTNAQVDALAVSGSNIFAGTNIGVYLSTNNGTSWSAVNNGIPASIQISAIAISGSMIFAGTRGDGIYLSTDNGANWTAENAGLTGSGLLFINCIALSGTTIYIGVGSGYGVWERPLSDFAGINEINENNNISVYPIPAKDNITIKNSDFIKDETISVYDIQGQLLLQRTILQAKIDIDISAFPSGVYVVEVRTEKGVSVKKFIKE